MWYTMNTLIPVKDPADAELQQILDALCERGLGIVTDADKKTVHLFFNDETHRTFAEEVVPTLELLGRRYASAGTVVRWRDEAQEGLFAIGPDEAAKRQALVDHHLERLRGLLSDDLEMAQADVARLLAVTRTLLEDAKRTLMIGADHDEQQLGMCYVIDAGPEEAEELVAEFQNQPDCTSVVYPEIGDFQQAGFFTARNLLDLTAALREAPDIYRVATDLASSTGSETCPRPYDPADFARNIAAPLCALCEHDAAACRDGGLCALDRSSEAPS